MIERAIPTGVSVADRFRDVDAQRLGSHVETVLVATYFPLLFLVTIAAPSVLVDAFGVPFTAAVQYAISGGLLAYLAGLLVLCR